MTDCLFLQDKVGDCRLMALACILNTFPCCVTTEGDDSFVLIYNMIVQVRCLCDLGV